MRSMRQTSICRLVGDIAYKGFDPYEGFAFVVMIGGHRAISRLEFDGRELSARNQVSRQPASAAAQPSVPGAWTRSLSVHGRRIHRLANVSTAVGRNPKASRRSPCHPAESGIHCANARTERDLRLQCDLRLLRTSSGFRLSPDAEPVGWRDDGRFTRSQLPPPFAPAPFSR
jgi:hypothetical protein